MEYPVRFPGATASSSRRSSVPLSSEVIQCPLTPVVADRHAVDGHETGYGQEQKQRAHEDLRGFAFQGRDRKAVPVPGKKLRSTTGGGTRFDRRCGLTQLPYQEACEPPPALQPESYVDEVSAPLHLEDDRFAGLEGAHSSLESDQRQDGQAVQISWRRSSREGSCPATATSGRQIWTCVDINRSGLTPSFWRVYFRSKRAPWERACQSTWISTSAEPTPSAGTE